MATKQHQEFTHHQRHGKRHHLHLLAGFALGVAGLSGFSSAQAQNTVGAIAGMGPAGSTVMARSNTGAHRKTTIKNDGHYVLRQLRLGKYTVTLERDGKVVDTRLHIPIAVGRTTQINFLCAHDQCAATPDQKGAN